MANFVTSTATAKFVAGDDNVLSLQIDGEDIDFEAEYSFSSETVNTVTVNCVNGYVISEVTVDVTNVLITNITENSFEICANSELQAGDTTITITTKAVDVGGGSNMSTKINGVTYNSVDIDGIMIEGDDTVYMCKASSTGSSSGSTGDTSGSSTGSYLISFYSNGSLYTTLTVVIGANFVFPDNPTRSGYSFMGWYTGEDGSGTYVTFPYIVTGDTTLYAYWITHTGVVIGFKGLTSSATLTWTDDIATVADYSKSTNGDYVSVSSPLDEVFPYLNIEEYTDSNGNEFIKFPKMWIRWVKNTSGYIDGIQISDYQADDDFFVPDCFLNPDISGEHNDCFYMGKYEGSGSSSKVYSVSNATPLVSITRANFRAGCRAYGTEDNYYNGYQQMDMSMYVLYNFLCMLYYRTSNIQTVYGGRTGSGNGSWSAASVTGTTDDVDGLNGWNTSTDCVKMLGVENPYGNIYKWVDGIFFDSTTIYTQRFPTYYDDSSDNSTAMGFTRPTNSGYYVQYLKSGTGDATISNVYCATAVSSSSSSYINDYYYYSSTGTVLSVGGNWSNATYAGLWCLHGSNAASSTFTYIGGRLCLRPS